MAEHCVCGNRLGESRVTIRRSPCRCDVPGPGPSVSFQVVALPDTVLRKQYDERKRLGLPVVAQIEEPIHRPRRQV